MTVHLVKLCVGAEAIDDLVTWQNRLQASYGKVFHTTRMVPKRQGDLLENGSIYWVIKRQIRVRQPIIDIEEFVDDQGIRRCHLHLDPELVHTRLQARRPFQGWRYLAPGDAPPDLGAARANDSELPLALAQELADIGIR